MDELLESLAMQNFVDQFEILVIEDGSTEKSDLIVKKYQQQLDLLKKDRIANLPP